jgi:acetyl esterase/lipase
MALKIAAALQRHDIKAARQAFETISDGSQYDAEFIPCDAGGVAAEWVITPGADTSRRVLFIHGGGFVMGSPKSHRTITSRFSEVSGCAVLSIDYRMMPEHKHRQCLEDCRTAYQWILENGPDGSAKIEQLFVGGDSAGGNLILSLLAWIRDNGLRAPEAAVAMSPLTDVTFSGASIKENLDTDHLLKPFMKPLAVLSPFSKSWWVYWTYKVRPANPLVSPLRGDLSNLPPTLVQVSSAEMLFDDARRYVYKARAAGSDARLQSWDDMLHIWQIFYPGLPQAAEAWCEIGKFLKKHPAIPGRD